MFFSIFLFSSNVFFISEFRKHFARYLFLVFIFPAQFFRSYVGEHRSDVSVLPRLVRQSLQEHDREHAISREHKATSEGPYQMLHLFSVRQHMPLALRERQAALLALAIRELAEQAGSVLDGPMDVPADWRRRPRESLC